MGQLRRLFRSAPVIIIVILATLLLAEVGSIAAQKAGWTPHDLAYYLDQNLVNFVRPGLVVKITAASIQDSKITVSFKLTDPKGLPLDREGVFTPGTVSTSFIAAYIPKSDKVYTAYTTRLQTSPITNKSAVQAGTDSGGTYAKVADGEYTYTFRTTLPATYDPTLTHSIGVYSSRNLTEFGLGTQYSNDVITWVPAGGAPKVVRNVVRTETCNKCHDPLQAHGGARRNVDLCVLCHTPQTTDPDTGNSVDMTEMVHKIHMGKDLPSVKAGKPYRIIGFQQGVNDYSTVAFPNQIRNCEVCHTSAAQANIYLSSPSRRACGACHDDVNFATGDKHVDLPQVSDNLCATCHIPQGELEYDASIKGAHTIASFSSQLPGTTFSIARVENTGRGQKPTVSFTLKDKKGNVLDASTMDFLNLILAGPTSDYNDYKSEDARKATRSGDQYVYSFTNAIPDNAVGTYVIGMEGYKNFKINPGTKKEQTVRDVGYNQLYYFGVMDSRPVPRRTAVTEEKCNTCHGTLLLHGTIRRNIEYCLICHNPNTTDVGRRNKPELLPAESVNFKTMIHKIHTGEDLKTDLTIYGFGNTPHNYNEVRFPGDRRDCTKCHVGTSYQLPLGPGLLASQAPRDYIRPLPPETGACLSCHTSKPAAAHAGLNISATLGEACSVCHGTSADFSVDKVHAR